MKYRVWEIIFGKIQMWSQPPLLFSKRMCAALVKTLMEASLTHFQHHCFPYTLPNNDLPSPTLLTLKRNQWHATPHFDNRHHCLSLRVNTGKTFLLRSGCKEKELEYSSPGRHANKAVCGGLKKWLCLTWFCSICVRWITVASMLGLASKTSWVW